MPSRFLYHTLLLLAATTAVYLWLAVASLSHYTLQLVAILVLLYMGTHWVRRHDKHAFHRSTITLDVTLLTAMVLLLVSETGALTSPLFFLCYFLLFAVSMLYEIEATLILTGVLILYFLFFPGTNLSDVSHLSELGALIMITPLAIFTGHEYEKTIEEKRKTATIMSHLQNEETDTLLFLSLNLKKTLVSALDSLSVAIPQTKVQSVRSSLETVYQDLKSLYRSSDELQQTVDRDSEEKK